MKNKKVFYGILAIIAILGFGLFVFDRVLQPEIRPSAEVVITTDKTEYEQGGVLKVKSENNFRKNICFSSCYSYLMEEKEKEWESYPPYQLCDTNRVEGCIKSGQVKAFEIDLSSAREGLKRIAIPVCIDCKKGDNFEESKRFYSNEFTIKEKTASEEDIKTKAEKILELNDIKGYSLKSVEKNKIKLPAPVEISTAVLIEFFPKFSGFIDNEVWQVKFNGEIEEREYNVIFDSSGKEIIAAFVRDKRLLPEISPLKIKEKSAIDPGCSQKVKGIYTGQHCLGMPVGYEFDASEGKCIEKTVGGCKAEIPFNTLEECQKVCENSLDNKVSISDLLNNPKKYVNQTINTEGIVKFIGENYWSGDGVFFLEDGNYNVKVSPWAPITIAHCPPTSENCKQPLTMGDYLDQKVRLTGIFKDNPYEIVGITNISIIGKELPFETIEKREYSENSERKNYVIKNNREWLDLLDKNRGGIDSVFTPPQVDFSKDMVIAVFQGERTSGGHNIEITKIIETDRNIEVYVKEESPGRGCRVTEAFTYPYHIVKVQKSDKEVIFKTEKIVTDCYWG